MDSEFVVVECLFITLSAPPAFVSLAVYPKFAATLALLTTLNTPPNTHGKGLRVSAKW